MPEGTWAVEFDYRADEGPDLVGPFPTKQDAELYIVSLDIGDFECGYRQLATPTGGDAAKHPIGLCVLCWDLVYSSDDRGSVLFYDKATLSRRPGPAHQRCIDENPEVEIA